MIELNLWFFVIIIERSNGPRFFEKSIIEWYSRWFISSRFFVFCHSILPVHRSAHKSESQSWERAKRLRSTLSLQPTELTLFLAAPHALSSLCVQPFAKLSRFVSFSSAFVSSSNICLICRLTRPINQFDAVTVGFTST